MAAHWVEIALVDYAVKLAMAVLGVLPLYGLLLAGLQRWLARSAVQAVAA